MKKIFLLFLIIILTPKLQGQNVNVDSIYNNELQKVTLINIPILAQYNQTTEITPFQNGTVLSNLFISGHAQLKSKKSLIRVVLVDIDYNEYLVYENNYLLTDSLYIEINNEYVETGYLSDIKPLNVKIIIDSATLYIDKFSYVSLSQMKGTIISSIKNDLLPNKNLKNLKKINSAIKSNNLIWIAGETDFSKLTYQEKKQYFGDTLPNLYGLEYYIGGIFEFPNYDSISQPLTNKSGSGIIGNFDWRNRHGIDWTTPVKDQGHCGSCWAFANVGAVEGLINLYYNRKLDMDLSEQQIVNCAHEQGILGCQGGRASSALNYMINHWIVDENSFPYIASNGDCSGTNIPNESIKISNKELRFKPEPDILKQLIIQKGQMSASINYWRHSMVLVGYGTVEAGQIYRTLIDTSMENNSNVIQIDPYNYRIGRTYWIFKNSWGNALPYVYALIEPQDFNAANIPNYPIISMNYTDADIVCEDRDGDGYYNWGIGPKPATCPNCPDEEDSDDSNPMFGPYDEGFYSRVNCDHYVFSETPMEIGNTSWEQWIEPKFINQKVIIKSGATLNIENTTIKFGENASINVEAGGNLIVEGSILTNACSNSYWQGINLEGNKDIPQSVGNMHGYVELIDAVIENARNAISCWKPEHWDKTGGIINARNTTFRNNIRSVEFLAYHNKDGNGNIKPNVSSFSNCDFIWDENMMPHDKISLSHVTMWDVEGVVFSSCNFSNSNFNPNIIHHGIISILSGFLVAGSDLNKKSFKDLEYGVRATNLDNKKFIIANTKFDRNFCGVFASCANNFVVNNCDFYIEPKNTQISGYDATAFGLFSDASTGYQIDYNNFVGNSGNNIIGLQIVNSGEAPNRVKNNNFENLFCGSQALGQNKSANTTTGLDFFCNSFSDCGYGIYISSYGGINNINGISQSQGYPGYPETNVFYKNSIYDMCNNDCDNIFYYASQAIPNIIPETCDNNNINIVPTSIYLHCNYNIIKTSNKDTLYLNLTTLNNEYLLLLYNYNNILDGGHKDVLLEKLEDSWSGSDWELRDSYIQESPYLSTDVLIELVKSEKLPLAMCAEILLSNPDATQKDDFREFMNKEDNYLTTLAKLLIEESWNSVTLRTNVESNISAKLGEIEFVSRDLINIILNDTLGLNINEYRNVLSDLRNISSKFELVDSYIGTQEYSLARNLLLELQSDGDNQKHYSEEIESYLIYLSIIEKAGNSNNIKEDDLISLSNYNTRVGKKAKSMLYFKGVNTNYHPIVLLEEKIEKSAKPSGKFSDLMKANIILSPNPAKDYITISYDLEPRKIEYSIKIYNNKGSIVYSGYLRGNKGIQNIDTRSFEVGTYLYNVENGNERCNNGKFIIVR